MSSPGSFNRYTNNVGENRRIGAGGRITLAEIDAQPVCRAGRKQRVGDYSVTEWSTHGHVQLVMGANLWGLKFATYNDALAFASKCAPMMTSQEARDLKSRMFA